MILTPTDNRKPPPKISRTMYVNVANLFALRYCFHGPNEEKSLNSVSRYMVNWKSLWGMIDGGLVLSSCFCWN